MSTNVEYCSSVSLTSSGHINLDEKTLDGSLGEFIPHRHGNESADFSLYDSRLFGRGESALVPRGDDKRRRVSGHGSFIWSYVCTEEIVTECLGVECLARV